MTNQTKHGGPRSPKGGRPPNPNRYRQYPLKLPPDIIEWLKENTDNKNGFIVEAIRQAIVAAKKASEAE